MIYYFSGVTDVDLAISLNIDVLYSAKNDRAAIKKVIEYKKQHPEYKANILIDSGAWSQFTARMKKGEEMTDEEYYNYTDEYIQYLNEYGDYFTNFVSVDAIVDPNNVESDYGKKTWDNYLYMYERLRPELRKKLIVTFHYQEDVKWLKNMLEYTHPDGSHIDYIGIAISTESSAKLRVRWAKKCMKIISESSNPHVKTHAFGVGVKSVLEEAPFTSADATSWVKRAAFGNIAIDDKTVCISDIQKENLSNDKHYSVRSTAYIEQVRKIIKERGFTEEELASDAKARNKFNIIDTIEWVSKLNEKNLEKEAHISVKELW